MCSTGGGPGGLVRQAIQQSRSGNGIVGGTQGQAQGGQQTFEALRRRLFGGAAQGGPGTLLGG